MFSLAHQQVPTPGPQVNEFWHDSQVSCLPRSIHCKNLTTANGASLTLPTRSLTSLRSRAGNHAEPGSARGPLLDCPVHSGPQP
jgi:hypothetical protein